MKVKDNSETVIKEIASVLANKNRVEEEMGTERETAS